MSNFYQKLSFWFPSIIWTGTILLIAIAIGHASDAQWGWLIVTAFLAYAALTQLYYLQRLNAWLKNPETHHLPDGIGCWNRVFTRLYKSRREDEKNRQQLTEWLARFRQTMSMLPDGVAIINADLEIEWCNPASERHLKVSLERDAGRRITNLLRDPVFVDYITLSQFEKPLNLALADQRLLLRFIPFEKNRQILVSHDVTAFERLDLMRQDFIANASHELRTPLTVINGFLELALDNPNMDSATRTHYLQLMMDQGNRMQHLIEDMLLLTQLDAQANAARTEKIDIAALFRQLEQEASALSNTTNAEHQFQFNCDPSILIGVKNEIHSAFSNLISNAIRYTPDGGQINISWQTTEAGATFSVQDNGIGIAKEDIPRLTERFFRVDKSRSRATKGTGLGLAIVKHVLMHHDSHLEIESELGKGSVFIARFSAQQISVS